LHLGSLYTAAASYLDAKSHGGQWLLRIEDLDRAREVPGSADRIVRTLERYGFAWDGRIERQSLCGERYERALEILRGRDLTFQCSCSRLQLEDESHYPGTCRTQPATAQVATSTRLRIEPGYVTFTDRILGRYRQEVAAVVGDAIIRRRDRVFAYLLAVVVDDAAQGVTHVVRGADLLDNTPRQIYLQRQLNLPLPVYAHVPALTEPDGTKLAKSSRSVAIEADSGLPLLLAVFSHLGLSPPASLTAASIAEAWRWAIAVWDLNRVPKRLNLPISG
jgi:glutamyl-Q tRNA(Asp) synthetase